MNYDVNTFHPDNAVALEQLPRSLKRLADFERSFLYKPEIFYNVSQDPTFDTRFLPTNSAVFDLPCYWIQRKYLYTYCCHKSCVSALNWPVGIDYHDEVLFPVHPLSIAYYSRFLSESGARDARDDGLRILAIPTSSVRTVLAWREHRADTAVYIKLTMLPSPMFGDRRLWTAKCAGCVGRTRLLEDSHDNIQGRLAFIPESLALCPKALPDASVIIRGIPEEVRSSCIQPVPLFALFGGDRSRRALLLTVAERSGLSPLDFVQEALCVDFADIWVSIAMTSGLLPECHGQNLLLALTPEFKSLGYFYYRDFDGLSIDWSIRRAQKLTTPRHMPYSWSWDAAYETMRVGVQRWDPVWWKFKVSWYAYARFVLSELNLCMREWATAGLIAGPALATDHLTTLFSHHVISGLERLSDTRCGARYNIFEQPGLFNRDLLLHRARFLSLVS